MSRRLLTSAEQILLEYVLRGRPEAAKYVPLLQGLKVIEMNDGGMGSLMFFSREKNCQRSFGKVIAELQAADGDGIPIFITVIIDTEEQLYELDIWKVDFSSVQKIIF